MKRKLSFLMAVVMVLSMLPAMSVSASTANSILAPGGVVKDDTNWAEETTARIPVLRIKDEASKLASGGAFTLTLSNAKWNLGETTAVTSGGTTTQVPNRQLYGNVYQGNGGADGFQVRAGSAVADLGRGANSIQGSFLTTANMLSYTVTAFGDTVLEVRAPVNTASTVERNIFIPMFVEMDGVGPATVTVSDIDAGVAMGTYTFATGAGGGTTTSITDADKVFSSTLNMGTLRIQETTPRTLEHDNGIISIYAPNGFRWVSTGAASAGGSGVEVAAYGGFNPPTNFTYVRTATAQGDSGKLEVFVGSELSPAGPIDLDATRNANGTIEIKGLRLARDGTVANTPTGDVRVRVEGIGMDRADVVVGVFSRLGVSMEAKSGTVPTIASGQYRASSGTSNDETGVFNSSIECIEVTVTENNINSWNVDAPAEFTLPEGVLFRGVELTNQSGINGMSRNPGSSARVWLSAVDEGDQDVSYRVGQPRSTTNPGSDPTVKALGGFLELTEDKFTVNVNTGGYDRRGRNTTNPDRIEMTFKVYVSIEAGFTGDIEFMTHEDNEAFSGNLSAVIATAVDPITATVASTGIEIGQMALPVADIVLKENVAGALRRCAGDGRSGDASPHFLYVGGYEANDRPNFRDTRDVKAEVVSGDIVLDDVRIRNGAIELNIRRESTTASEVKISGLTMDFNRSIAHGSMELRMGGAIVTNHRNRTTGSSNRFASGYGRFETDFIVLSPNYVNILNDAGGFFTREISVTVGSTTMIVEGQEVRLPVAPINVEGTVLVPVRAVTEVFADWSVNWDPHTKMATIVDPARGTIQFKADDNYIFMNGTPIYYAGAPCQNVNGNLMLPFRALCEIVLGVPSSRIVWDQATNTGHINPRDGMVQTPVAPTPAPVEEPDEEDTETETE